MSDWSLVKLEMARSAGYPFGSVSRAYFIRVPLDRIGMIDGAGVAQAPKRATVRRFWPNEPDMSDIRLTVDGESSSGNAIPLCKLGHKGGNIMFSYNKIVIVRMFLSLH